MGTVPAFAHIQVVAQTYCPLQGFSSPRAPASRWRSHWRGFWKPRWSLRVRTSPICPQPCPRFLPVSHRPLHLLFCNLTCLCVFLRCVAKDTVGETSNHMTSQLKSLHEASSTFPTRLGQNAGAPHPPRRGRPCRLLHLAIESSEPLTIAPHASVHLNRP